MNYNIFSDGKELAVLAQRDPHLHCAWGLLIIPSVHLPSPQLNEPPPDLSNLDLYSNFLGL